jgi:nitrate reductase beta subunit
MRFQLIAPEEALPLWNALLSARLKLAEVERERDIKEEQRAIMVDACDQAIIEKQAAERENAALREQLAIANNAIKGL